MAVEKKKTYAAAVADTDHNSLERKIEARAIPKRKDRPAMKAHPVRFIEEEYQLLSDYFRDQGSDFSTECRKWVKDTIRRLPIQR
jgi:hypothetical protein